MSLKIFKILWQTSLPFAMSLFSLQPSILHDTRFGALKPPSALWWPGVAPVTLETSSRTLRCHGVQLAQVEEQIARME